LSILNSYTNAYIQTMTLYDPFPDFASYQLGKYRYSTDTADALPPPLPGPSAPQTKCWSSWFWRPKKPPKQERTIQTTPTIHELTSNAVEQDLSTLDATLAACVIVEPEVRECKLRLAPKIAEAVEATIAALNPDAPGTPLKRVAEIYREIPLSLDGTLPAKLMTVDSLDALQPPWPMITYSLGGQNEQLIAIEAILAAQTKIIDILANVVVEHQPSRRPSMPSRQPSRRPSTDSSPQPHELLNSEVVDIARHAVGELRNAYHRELQLVYIMESGQRPRRGAKITRKSSHSTWRSTDHTSSSATLPTTTSLQTPQAAHFLVSPSPFTSRSTALGGSPPPSPSTTIDQLLHPRQIPSIAHGDGIGADWTRPAERATYTQFARDNVRALRDAIHALKEMSQGGKYDNRQD
jgi:hypothetical protein